MSLENTFEAVAPSIVAFGSKIVRAKTEPPFPPLLGTGFFIDARGIVATNRHVVEELMKLQPNPKTGEGSAFAIVFSGAKHEGAGHSISGVTTDIVRADLIDSFVAPDGDYYGEPVPDIAFVQLGVQEVPVLKLATDHWSWRIGMSIATAGFAMGTAALAIYGKVNSITPLLRHGIISSLFPFPCPTPHGFTVDIVSQGGQSGSPIFLPNEPLVVGLLHAGFPNENITLAVPSFIVAEAFRALKKVVQYDTANIPTLAEKFAKITAPNVPTWNAV